MRQQGYAVKITGFLPVDKSDLGAQIGALTAIQSGDTAAILAMCKNVSFEQNLTSREVDSAGNPLPKKLRQPRAKKTDAKAPPIKKTV